MIHRPAAAALIATGSTAASALATVAHPAFWSAASLLCSAVFSAGAWLAARIEADARIRARAESDALAESVARAVAQKLASRRELPADLAALASTVLAALKPQPDPAPAPPSDSAASAYARGFEAAARRFAPPTSPPAPAEDSFDPGPVS